MSEQSGDTKPCPYCGEEIRASAIVCRFCNRPLPGHENEVPPQISPPPHEKPTRLKGRLIFLSVLLLVVAIGSAIFLLGGKSLLPKVEPCYVQSSEFINQLQTYFDNWNHANNVASSTSEIDLSPAVMQLQSIRRRVTYLDAPTCASEVQVLMIDYMDKVIDSYLVFMSDDPDSVLSLKMDDAQVAFDKCVTEFTKLKTGLPPYDK